MKKRIIGRLIATCLLTCAAGFFGVAGLSFSASAEGTETSATPTVNDATHFVMGASVRLKSSADDETGNGIRFSVCIEKETFDLLLTENGSLKSTVTTGTLLLPESELPASVSAPTLETNGVENVPTGDLWREKTYDGTVYMESLVYLWGIPETSYDENIVAVGYIKDGDTLLHYTQPLGRSMAYVAKRAVEDGNTDASLAEYIPTYRIALNNTLYNTVSYVTVEYGEAFDAETYDCAWYTDEACTQVADPDALACMVKQTDLYTNDNVFFGGEVYYSRMDDISASADGTYAETIVTIPAYDASNDPRVGIALKGANGNGYKMLLIQLNKATGAVNNVISLSRYKNASGGWSNGWANDNYSLITVTGNFTASEGIRLGIWSDGKYTYYYVNGTYAGRDSNIYIDANGNNFTVIGEDENTCATLVSWYADARFENTSFDYTDGVLISEAYGGSKLTADALGATLSTASQWEAYAYFSATGAQNTYMEAYMSLSEIYAGQDARIGFALYDVTNGKKAYSVLFNLPKANAETFKATYAFCLPRTSSGGNDWGKGKTFTYTEPLTEKVKLGLYKSGTTLYVFVNDVLAITQDASAYLSAGTEYAFGLTSWNVTECAFENAKIFTGANADKRYEALIAV